MQNARFYFSVVIVSFLCLFATGVAHAASERLSPVPLSHTVKIPYGYTMSESSATAIAETFALHGAFARAAQWIEHRQKLAWMADTPPALGARQETLAANQLYNFHRSKIFRSHDVENYYISTEVTISPLSRFDEKRRDALQPTSRSKLYESIFVAEETALAEYSDALYQNKHIDYLRYIDSDLKLFFDKTARRLSALKAYRKIVPQYSQGAWKNPKQVLEKITMLLNLDPEEPNLLHAKGTLLFQLKDTLGAIQYYNDALKLNPNLVVALHDRGTAYVRANLPYMAIADYDKAISLSPKNPHLYISHGSADLVIKNYPALCANYQKGCSLGLCEEINWAIARGLCQ
ncbi:hypothetical protein [Halodesulfovibrio sp.]|jgi:tetratricopeptide (TPR) repeat protein|uniref:tetratricopeptide repeat protein n=1 Tax=Halodesulfovibrio sp. TaxID=1912772 RepID=UPI0025DA1331|nr:hypothetical protein [Halodesulfovibrio sp.]MCT4534649.1 hypothetical protein [Halodesulfovibrio sp.]